jgi:hypothetical protein
LEPPEVLPPYWLPGLGGVVAFGVDWPVDELDEGDVDVDCDRDVDVDDDDGDVDMDGVVGRCVDAREAGNSPAALDPLIDPMLDRDGCSDEA